MPANKFGTFQNAWQRSFFVTLFFVLLAALLFWLDGFRTYQSEVRLMVIGKVPSVATDQVVENMSELSTNLSFYERLIEENPTIEDDFVGYTKDQRKKLWNETVEVVRSDKSGVLSVTAKAETPEEAKRLAEATVKTLFSVASFYYNIKTDLDLRVVDESIVKTTVDRPFLYVLTSFGSALVVVIVFFGFLFLAPLLLGRKREMPAPEFPVGASVPFIDPRKFVPARPATLTFESSHGAQQTKEEKVVPETVTSERMLPGMDVSELPFQFEDTYTEEPEAPVVAEELADLPVMNGFVTDRVTPKEADAPVQKGEPTVEEYKRRLNELLAGGK